MPGVGRGWPGRVGGDAAHAAWLAFCLPWRQAVSSSPLRPCTRVPDISRCDSLNKRMGKAHHLCPTLEHQDALSRLLRCLRPLSRVGRPVAAQHLQAAEGECVVRVSGSGAPAAGWRASAAGGRARRGGTLQPSGPTRGRHSRPVCSVHRCAKTWPQRLGQAKETAKPD